MNKFNFRMDFWAADPISFFTPIHVSVNCFLGVSSPFGYAQDSAGLSAHTPPTPRRGVGYPLQSLTHPSQETGAYITHAAR